VHYVSLKQYNWKRRVVATFGNDNFYSLALLDKWGVEKREVVVDEENEEEYLKLTLVC